jgi:predicted transcriptional regulator
MDNINGISQRIKELVDYYAGGNNSKFAVLTGTSEANVRNYINGRQPKFDYISSLVKCFEINYDWLFTGDGPMNKGNNGYSTNNDHLKVEDTIPIYKKKKEIDNDKVYIDIIKSQEEKIQELNRSIGRLEYEVEMLKQNRQEEPDVMDVGCAAVG